MLVGPNKCFIYKQHQERKIINFYSRIFYNQIHISSINHTIQLLASQVSAMYHQCSVGQQRARLTHPQTYLTLKRLMMNASDDTFWVVFHLPFSQFSFSIAVVSYFMDLLFFLVIFLATHSLTVQDFTYTRLCHHDISDPQPSPTDNSLTRPPSAQALIYQNKAVSSQQRRGVGARSEG